MKQQTERLEMRLSPETKAAWQARADSEGRTISAMVRHAVDGTAGDDGLVEVEIDCTEDCLRAWGAEAAVLGVTLEAYVREALNAAAAAWAAAQAETAPAPAVVPVGKEVARVRDLPLTMPCHAR